MVGGSVYQIPAGSTQRSQEQMKKNIPCYNLDDVMATRQLEVWLRAL